MNKELNIFTLRMLRDQYEAEHMETEVEALEQPDLQPTCNQLATDCISRAAANDAYCMHECGMKYTDCDDEYCGSIFADIPSAQPERGRGKWIIHKGACEPDYMECSRCKWITEYYGGLEETWDFCPHCGCEMCQEGEEE